MFKGALFLALGFLTVCFPVAAQQTKHSEAAQHRAATSGTTTFGRASTLSLYRSNVIVASNASLLFHNGPVRTWSDGAQLASETALAQIGMAPLGLFPTTYLAPSDVGAVLTRKLSAAPDSRSANLVADGKDRDAQPQAALRRDAGARRFVIFAFTGAEEFTGLSKRPSPQSSSRL